jgi:hypothetical protein
VENSANSSISHPSPLLVVVVKPQVAGMSPVIAENVSISLASTSGQVCTNLSGLLLLQQEICGDRTTAAANSSLINCLVNLCSCMAVMIAMLSVILGHLFYKVKLESG